MKKTVIKSSVYFSVLVFSCLCLVCGGGGDTYTIEIVDGVKNIHNQAPAWGDEPKVELKFVQKIGDLDSDDDNYAFFRPRDVIYDSGGNIYVLDTGNSRILKFDPQGKYIRTIGRAGQGPAEFLAPLSITIDSNGDILTADAGNRRIQIFKQNGEFVGGIKTNTYVSVLRYLSPGSLVTRIPESNRMFSIFDMKGNILTKFGIPRMYSENLVMTNINGNENTFEVDNESNIIVNFHHQNIIQKYSSDGTLNFQTDRPLNFPVLDQPEMIESKINVGGQEYISINARFTDVSRGVGTDSKNRIWVATYREQPAPEENTPGSDPEVDLDFDIFDKYGIFLGKIESDRSFNKMRIFGDRLFIIDTYYTMSIYEYRIVEK